MLNNEGSAAANTILLSPVSAANTAAATSSWVDVRNGVGHIVVAVQTGAVTGSITWTVEHASDSSGTGGAAITPDDGAFSAGAANQVQTRVIDARRTAGYLRVVGTIVTGPSLVAAHLRLRPKTV